jgi:hypothetical protein
MADDPGWKFVATGNVAKGFFAFGNVATGFFAFGNVAYGVVSVGFSLSTGVVAIGLNAIGLVAAFGLNGVAPVSIAAINSIGGFAVGGVNAMGGIARGGVNAGPAPLAALVVAVIVLAASFLLPKLGPGELALQRRRVTTSLAELATGASSSGTIAARLLRVGTDTLDVGVAGRRAELSASSWVLDAAAAAIAGGEAPVYLDLEAHDEVGAPVPGAGYREAGPAPVRRVIEVRSVTPAPVWWLDVLAASDGAMRWAARGGAIVSAACFFAR